MFSALFLLDFLDVKRLIKGEEVKISILIFKILDKQNILIYTLKVKII